MVKMSSLGDVIHTLPALSDAAVALPGIRFDWVVEEAFAEIPAWHPAVDKVIPVALRRWRKRPLRDFRGPQWRQAREALRRQHYDAVIDAQGLIKSAFIARLVKAPRYGLDRHSVRERLASSVYHHGITVPRDMHAVDRTRMLFARALRYSQPATSGDYGLRENLSTVERQLPPGLLFFHGTARPEKLWPVRHWQALAELAVADGYRVWLPWGNEAEKTRAESLASVSSEVQVLPPLKLSGLASLLLEVRAAVAVDTGLGHLAAALDVPTVSLYGPTRPSLVGAYGANQLHLRAAEKGEHSRGAADMGAIEPAEVWRQLQSLLPDRQPDAVGGS